MTKNVSRHCNCLLGEAVQNHSWWRPTGMAREPFTMCWSGHQCYLYCNGRGTQNLRHLNSTKLGVTRSRTFVERSTEEDPICSGGTLLTFSLGLHWKMDLRAKPVHKTAGGRFGLQNTTSFAGAVHANCCCYVLIINDYELFFTAHESMS